MSVAHGIVVSHDGAIVVDSVVGRGSVFHVYLPLAAAPDPAVGPTRVDTSSHARLDGVRVLCVDDDPVMLVTIGALLERQGCDVITAA